MAPDADPAALARELSFPCVVKPLGLSGSRGVIRADDPAQFVTAFERLRRLLMEPAVQAARDSLNDAIIIEGFVAGREFALEGIVEAGRLHTLALFDKPDPLDGPFFEETTYVTPSGLPARRQREVEDVVARAITAIGLRHGPVHAECRVQDEVVVLEVAARPIGGLCAKALRFEDPVLGTMSLEELLLRDACGESVERAAREAGSSGVMMIPIPARGIYRRVEGVDAAGKVPGVEDVRITAKPDQLLVPLPEGASYLGFIFARRERPEEVVQALRAAHTQLRFVIDREIAVSRSDVRDVRLKPDAYHVRDTPGADLSIRLSRTSSDIILGMTPCSPPQPSPPSGNKSGHKVFCVKFQKELPGLDDQPWPGELGRRIYENVSGEAWKLWEERMKMILNEYRLMPWQKEAQDLVVKHMEDFFFGEGAALPPGYVPQQAK